MKPAKFEARGSNMFRNGALAGRFGDQESAEYFASVFNDSDDGEWDCAVCGQTEGVLYDISTDLTLCPAHLAEMPPPIAAEASACGETRVERLPLEEWRELRREIIERDGGKCRYCGATKWLEVDHIDPISKGGGNNRSNLVTACHRCNRSKGRKRLEDWLDERDLKGD